VGQRRWRRSGGAWNVASIRGVGRRRAVVALEQPRSDQPFGGGALCGARGELPGRALRAGRASARCSTAGSGEVERFAVVRRQRAISRSFDEPRAWSERVAAVTEPCQAPAGVREARFESSQRVDGAVVRVTSGILSEPADARLGSSRPSFSAAHRLRTADKADCQKRRVPGPQRCVRPSAEPVAGELSERSAAPPSPSRADAHAHRRSPAWPRS
jgi:hypothetical protein